MEQQFRDADGQPITLGVRAAQPHLGTVPGFTLRPSQEAGVPVQAPNPAPADGTYRLGRGNFRIRKGDPLPEGAEFMPKGQGRPPKPTTESAVSSGWGENAFTGDPIQVPGHNITATRIEYDAEQLEGLGLVSDPELLKAVLESGHFGVLVSVFVLSESEAEIWRKAVDFGALPEIDSSHYPEGAVPIEAVESLDEKPADLSTAGQLTEEPPVAPEVLPSPAVEENRAESADLSTAEPKEAAVPTDDKKPGEKPAPKGPKTRETQGAPENRAEPKPAPENR